MPDRLWGAMILGDRLDVDGIGEWSFDGDRVIFFDAEHDMADFLSPPEFVKDVVRIYSGAACTLGVVHRGDVLWHFRRTGEIVSAYRMPNRILGLDQVEEHGDRMWFSCEVGFCVFEDDRLAWSHEFEEGLSYETLAATPNGIEYETFQGDLRTFRWSDGAPFA